MDRLKEGINIASYGALFVFSIVIFLRFFKYLQGFLPSYIELTFMLGVGVLLIDMNVRHFGTFVGYLQDLIRKHEAAEAKKNHHDKYLDLFNGVMLIFLFIGVMVCLYGLYLLFQVVI